ncbi:TIGR04255 family protein [Blastopirellula marina]|uniref:TIGR04255 family protein n=2 Tax=Pirellulales TaxID=2691354 RepID=A0A2S8FFU0_9BACT|nr:TIGR04255 family protein [Blastopirellula marina]RCS51427.1 TIGR04255 family protein [Bremerella cremea]
MKQADFKINLTESFEHLPDAPIAEAIIHWRARAERKLVPNEFQKELKSRLPDYPHHQQQFEMAAEINAESQSFSHQQNWHGFRFETEDKRYVAQFTRNGFVFSRLQPYENWNTFRTEAIRLWEIYRELTEPSEIQRLGVRFINVIKDVTPTELNDLLAAPPRCAPNLNIPLAGFMHQSVFEIPGHPYNLNVIQTIQPAPPTQKGPTNLILDLDVSTSRFIATEEINKRLQDMQWIKNKAFFSFLTKSAISKFRE